MRNSVSRRDFLKLSMASGSLGVLTGLPDEALALSSGDRKNAAKSGRTPQYKLVQGYCPFCQSRCTYNAHIENGKVRFLTGLEENRWTGGGMCPKGMSMLELVDSPHRITEPMLRTPGGWKNISYNEAIDLVVEKLQAAKAKHGNQIAKRLALTAPLWDCRESELAALMTMRFAGGINIMPPGEVCISTASSTLNTLLGSGNSTTTVDEIENASLLILWGANLTETYPPYTRWLEKARERGVRVVYLDCRKTRTSNWADMQFFPRPGSDGALALGCVNWLIGNAVYDAAYVAQHTNNFETLKQDAAPWGIPEVAEATGLSPDDILSFYKTFANSPRSIIWMGGSLSRYANGMPTIRSIVAMQALCNNIMGQGSGLLTMESGKPEGEKEFIDHVCGKAPAGVNFRRLLMAMNKKEIDVFFLNSSYRRYPDCNGVKQALRNIDFVVHRGFFKTEELDVAHLFVPATFSLESQGSHYGAEKQVVWRDKCVDAPGSCVPDWQFYRDIGRKIAPQKYPAFENPEELASLFSETLPEWKGITVERLRKSPGGLVGPIPETDGPEQLGCIFPDGKYRTSDGKLDFLLKAVGPIVWTPPKGSPDGPERDPKYPLILIQGKVVTQWQQTMTNFALSLAQFSNGRYALVHPETAKSLGIAQGEQAFLETAFGRLPTRVEVSSEILPGVVFTPSHFTGSSPYAQTRSDPMNTILPNYWDRISAQFNGLGCTLLRA